MNCKLFGFAKKKNSTQQPDLTTGTDFTVQLKEQTNINSPVLILTMKNAQGQQLQPNIYNYVYIPIFRRYYFINDWRYLNATWECYCTCDVLASFKNEIGNLNAYVLRSSFTYDGDVIDTLYPCKAQSTKDNSYYDNDFFSMALSNTGFYVVGIINNAAAATDGCVTYYMMTAAELGQLKSFLMSDNFLSLAGMHGISGIPDAFIKSYFDPMQYIVSCRFFPVDYGVTTQQAVPVAGIQVGWWTITLATKRMPSGFYADIQSNNVRAGIHPQAVARGDYLNHAPYTERILIHPMLGTISLDANKIDANDQITVSTRIDFTTGEALTYVGNASKNITLYTQAYQLAVNVQLAQISQDMFAMGRSVIDGVKGLFSGEGGVGGKIASAVSGIWNGLEATQPILSSSGCNGNRAVYHVAVWFQSWYKKLVDEDNTDRGRPLCKMKMLRTIPGFILCSEAHANFVAFDSEKTEIENYLNTGFFYD